MKSRHLPRLIAPSILFALALASTASGQWVEDSIDVGGAWVGSLAYNPLMDVVYGGCHVAGIFFVIDCATNSVLTRWNLPRPQSLVYDSIDDRVYCTTGSSDYDTVYVIDGTTFQPVARIPVYWALEAVWDPDRNRVYVSSGEDNEIAVIDCTTDSVIATVHVGRYPIKMSLNRQHGKLYVLNTDGESVSIVDLEALEETEEIRLDNVPECGLYSEATGKFYCGGYPAVTAVDGVGDSVVAEVRLPDNGAAYALAENPEAGVVLVGVDGYPGDHICAVATGPDTLLSALSCPAGPQVIHWSARSRQFYVGLRVGVVAVVNSDGSSVVAEVPVQDSPFCMALSPQQHRLFVGHLNTRYVYVIRDEVGGVAESGSTRLPRGAAAVVRSTLKTDSPGLLLDVSGRAVMRLLRGENDVRRLAPRVYAVTTARGVTRRVVKVR